MMMSAPSSRSDAISLRASRLLAGSIWYVALSFLAWHWQEGAELAMSLKGP